MTTWKELLHPGDAASFFDRDPLPAFDAAAVSYRQSNAWWLAELSRLVYRHDVEEPNPVEPSRASFLARAGLRQQVFFQSDKTGTQAFLVRPASGPDFAALVFRGTEQDIRDFRSDLETLPVPVGRGGVLVHDGFEKALDSVWRDIDAELSRLGGPIFYAGHSLGAALATLAAARQPPRAAYTFGSPRVGNAEFVDSLRSVPLYRLVHGEDAITEVPPEILGFRHAGELHRVPPRPGPRRGPGLLGWLRGLWKPPGPLADHAPIGYVEGLISSEVT